MEKNQNVRTKNAFMPFFFHKNFAKIFYKLIPLGHLLKFFFSTIFPHEISVGSLKSFIQFLL